MRGSCLLLLAACRARAGPSPACSDHAGCAGLTGDCCPSDSGANLACCSGYVLDPGFSVPAGGAGVTDSEALQFSPETGGAGEGPSVPVSEKPSSSATSSAADPGGCAVDITAGIASITSAAKFITYATDDCPGGDQASCADSITSAITDFAGASKAIASACSTCGKMDTACAVDITNTVASLSASSEILICASTDCDEKGDAYDAFACIVDIFDVVDTMVHFSKSIYDAVDHCAPVPLMCGDKQGFGQVQVVLENCVGLGCNANGNDANCAWCVNDMPACTAAMGHDICQATMGARESQGVVACTSAGAATPTSGLRRLSSIFF